MEKNVRSRTSSSSHPLSTSSSRVGLNSSSSLSPDQFSNILRNRSDFSQGSSIPTTPAPTPLLHVSHHMHPEQLAAGIKQLKIDEGYIDSTSFPGTPAPSPFSPSPAQALGFSPDQIAEGIKRLREEGAVSGNSTGQPPTPSTTPGLAVIPPNHNWEAAIPERLLETVRHLHCDEGLESGSNPATPVPTPTTGSLRGQQDYFPPEQLAAGIHRLKVEEGMSSGGSSGFPSTPAPTPFSHLAGGVLPEDLAAGISRLSVIEEADSNAPVPEQSVIVEIGSIDKSDGDNNLATAAILNSCRESNVNLPEMEVLSEKVSGEAEIQVEVAASNSQETTRMTVQMQNPTDEVERPTTLPTTSSNISSLYATPTAPTPVADSSNMYSNYRKDIKNPSSSVEPSNNLPITAPLPNMAVHSNITLPQVTLPSSFPDGPKDEFGDELWIPNQLTAGVLKNMAKSPGSYFPEKTTLTFTHLFSREENKDPIKNLVTHFHGPSEAARRSHIPNADTVSQDFEGLKLLIQSECYRSAITLTGRILESMGQVVKEQNNFIKHNPTSLEIWFIRLSLLVKLNLINKAEAEAEPFQPDGDKPDLYYDFYPSEFPGKSGPMISFSFRLLLAQIPQLHGKPHETLDRLYALWGKIKKILINIPHDESHDARRSWCQREICVLYALVNSYLMQNDYVLAVETTMTLLEKERSERKAGVYSMLGRIYLQLGDVESAKKSFDSASELRNSNDQADVCNNLIDASLLAIGNNAYEKAFSILQKAREISNDPVIVNNMSVCLLPQGRLAESLSLLETSITNDPVHYQFEEPIRNLSTLYDLESSYVGQKRQRLLGLIAQYKGDGFNPSCIQLPT